MAIGKEAFVKNVEVLAYHDLDGRPGFRIAMQANAGRYHLYLAHCKHSGWAILDVADVSKPEYLRFVPGSEKPGQVTLKIQVADGLMTTAPRQGIPFRHCNSFEDPF